MAKSHRHITFIFGDPGAGKSWLATQLHEEHGYSLIALDELYLEFVKELYPHLHLDSLNLVISQHYKYVLLMTDPKAEKAWAQYVINLIRAHPAPFLAVEGYLLHPILKRVQKAFPYAQTVYVRDRRYYLESSIDMIA